MSFLKDCGKGKKDCGQKVSLFTLMNVLGLKKRSASAKNLFRHCETFARRNKFRKKFEKIYHLGIWWQSFFILKQLVVECVRFSSERVFRSYEIYRSATAFPFKLRWKRI